MELPVGLSLAICLLPFPGGVLGADVPLSARPNAEGDLWWHQMFSISFDGHGNFVSRHLDTLHTTAARLGAVGYHGPRQADLARDVPWMRVQEQSFAHHPKTRRVIYVEGNNAKKVLARVCPDGRVLFTLGQLAELPRNPLGLGTRKSRSATPLSS